MKHVIEGKSTLKDSNHKLQFFSFSSSHWIKQGGGAWISVTAAVQLVVVNVKVSHVSDLTLYDTVDNTSYLCSGRALHVQKSVLYLNSVN